MKYTLYGIAAFIALGAILTIVNVGKERKPTTPGTAATIAVIDAALVTVLVIAAGHLA